MTEANQAAHRKLFDFFESSDEWKQLTIPNAAVILLAAVCFFMEKLSYQQRETIDRKWMEMLTQLEPEKKDG